MLSQQDLQQIAALGISPAEVERQLQQHRQGFPYLRLRAAASVGNGIMAPTESQRAHYISAWNRYKDERHRIVKFVPASGAASRMFKDLFAFLEADYDEPTTDFEKEFFEQRRGFAFRKELCRVCKRDMQASVCSLVEAGRYKDVVRELLGAEGLNYGALPKGLLLFHSYDDGPRTPLEEHLVEAALYAASGGEANVHFTVSHEHLPLFQAKVAEKVGIYERTYGVRFNVSFSEQKSSTDTLAANPDHTPFRNEDGTLLFRPGGHGALIQNLNEVEGDVVFIKNIDNVVPDRLKPDTVVYKQLLAGILVELQQRAFGYLRLLDSGRCSRPQLDEMARFLNDDLCCRRDDTRSLTDAELSTYLRSKLNRPLRVCGVVKNVGEPGGGPFLIDEADGTVSLQILESSQIDSANADAMRMFREGTHFNPVDLVCGLRNYQGQPFHLPDFVDPATGFISSKSKNGRTLKALELPGLWNGAMSRWNTIFVEVPLSTFNPVKTVNDLLRPEHQSVSN
ncbi:DUF4301 family protein [Prevotella sp. oral taxon 475]|uniref:DUF4301 family protein n=1 Tax=Prevotella sp. oral taxon 475 TaxID=712471 RepID=UPI001BA9CDF0|nr:DUF4301 family protein [Prevotella sp. oral taxon 475]QUB46608.1 DUF4301 family protein [Prevotella sp. oral taxon 475]